MLVLVKTRLQLKTKRVNPTPLKTKSRHQRATLILKYSLKERSTALIQIGKKNNNRQTPWTSKTTNLVTTNLDKTISTNLDSNQTTRTVWSVRRVVAGNTVT